MALTSIGREDYLREVGKQYRRASKKHRGELLDAAELLTKLHRKYLIMRLGHMPIAQASKMVRRGRKRRYDDSFHTVLLVCWHASNDICAERIQPFLPELVSKLQACDLLTINDKTKELVLQASISTVARHLRREKRRSTVGLGTTKPGSLLKKQIAVRHGRWDEAHAGWLETDTVAHCGESAEDHFIYSYNFTDIATSWSEQVACMGKGERNTVHALTAIRQRLPFVVKGIDSDNGGEYINYHLQRYCEREKLTFTRSRPYRKNDNAHVEQKNWSAIRHMIGYARFDTPEQLELMNELYGGPLRLYMNYFQPVRKRRSKIVDIATGKKRKYYFEAQTPYQRILADSTVSQETKDWLQSEYNKRNPVKLLAEIERVVNRLRS